MENDLSPRTKNNISTFITDLNDEIIDKGDNMWGLFSGVTKYTTHHLTKKDKSLTKMYDIHGKREKSIYNMLVETF
jgi:hypothetical protein